jgi:hypothetical protein
MSTLYETDHIAWIDEQVAKLRSLVESRSNLDLDIGHLIEALEAMAQSDKAAVASYARQIIVHMLLLRYSPAAQPRYGWEAEIAAFRAELHDRLTTTLVRYLTERLDHLYAQALDIAVKKEAMYNSQSLPAPDQRPPELTIDRLLEPDWVLSATVRETPGEEEYSKKIRESRGSF